MGRKSRLKQERRIRAAYERRWSGFTPHYPPNAEYVRAEAASKSETYLRALCDKTFLSLWSYPNTFTDDGKELCDLLVVFENTVIIFSDKDCEFPDSGNLDLDWSRWYRRAIERSAEQLFGAERWIRNHPDRIFLDAKSTKPFPIPIPINENTVFYRLVVAHGSGERCVRELGQSPSLMVNSAVVGDDHVRPRAQGGLPFMVGQVNPAKGFIHVLDDLTLDILLRTLDTFTDLCSYLKKKEQCVRKGIHLAGTGEEELLGFYLMTMNEQNEYDFVFSEQDLNHVSLDEGFWQRFLESDQRKSQRAANRSSYLWDGLIERFTQHFLDGTSPYMTDTTLASHATIFRFFAREPRIRRRILSDALLDMVEVTPADMRRIGVIPPSRHGDPHFVFLLLPHPPSMAQQAYREARFTHLEMCAQVVKLKYPEALDIVGVATESGTSTGRSEDAIYFDARTWTREMASRAAEDQQRLQILVAPTTQGEKVYDYPIDDLLPNVGE